MAPRSAKSKKAADIKAVENEAPKKNRGKAKNVEDIDSKVAEVEVNEKVTSLIEKKSKRGRKVANEQEVANDTSSKKGRKKNVEEPVSEEKFVPNDDDAVSKEQNDDLYGKNGQIDDVKTNGHSEETQNASTGRGRKKQQKKEPKAGELNGTDTKTKETGKSKKNAKQESAESKEVEKVDVTDEKPNTSGKSRGRKAQLKADKDAQVEEDTQNIEEEPQAEPTSSKGKKKGQTKATKGSNPDIDKNEEVQEEAEEKKDTEPSEKRGAKSRKNQGKKAQAKETVDKEESNEEAPVSKKRKVIKKEEKGRGEPKEEQHTEENVVDETKPAKGKRGQEKTEVPLEINDQDTGEPTTKRKRKPTDDKAPVETSKSKAPLKNKATTNYDELDFSNSSKNAQGKEWNFKIASWNVDGVRAWLNKGGLDYIHYEKPNILCLQEIKCAQNKLPDEVANLPGYHAYWLCSDKDGYAGVGIYTTKLAMNVQYGIQNEELDSEGRIITAEYEQFYLICTYVPNAGRKLVTLPKRLQWNEEFRKYVKELDKKKPVIICGDMNVAHNEIDLANPKTNRKNAGFTDEERSGMTELLGEGFVDTYRHLNPDKTGAYTFWTYMMNSRAKNVGWRLDYFIVSERLLSSICDSVIRDNVYGSDHCPISLFLHLSSADKPKE